MGFCLLKKCGKKKASKPTPPPAPPAPSPSPSPAPPGQPPPGGDTQPPCNCCGHVRNLDQLSQVHRIKSIDLIRAKIYRVNYWNEDTNHYDDDRYCGTAPPAPLLRSARSLPPPRQYCHYGSPPPVPYYDQPPPPQRRYGPPLQRHFGPPPPRRHYAPPPPQYDYYGYEGRAPPQDYYGYGDY